MWTKLSVLAGVTLGLLTAILFACSGGGGDATGTVRVSVADKSGDYQSVVITITDVGVVSNTGGTTYTNLDPELKIDILDINYDDGEWLQVADVLVAAGKYNQFRLVLAENEDCFIPTNPAPSDCANYVVDQGVVYPLNTPSGQSSGLKIKTPSNFDVGANQTVEIILDIVPENAIHLMSSGEEYTIDPTGIRIIEGQMTVSPGAVLSGEVRVPLECRDFFVVPNDPFINPVFTVTAVKDGPEYTTIGVATEEGGGEGEEYIAGLFSLDAAEDDEYRVTASWKNFIVVSVDPVIVEPVIVGSGDPVLCNTGEDATECEIVLTVEVCR